MTKYRRLWLVLVLVLVGAVGLVAGAATAEGLPDFTRLAKENSPAVVNISTTQKVRRRLPPGFEMPDLPEDSPWGDLLRKFFGDGDGLPEGHGAQSLGSGFIIEPDGYIVTNYHVVRDAEEIIVRLQDRRELKARVVGKDERSDIALLKVEAKDLPVVRIGRSAELEVGEWVMAIGSPFGFDHSVSVGVVSAMGRSLPSESYVPFIQTDVAINPGNSGGPLFNLDGEVVGINSQIYSRTGGFMGLSFAIPIDVAMDVVRQLKTKGRVERGMLGILIQDVNRDLAESFGMDRPRGAVVLRVLPDTPAEKAGFKVGDVVVEYDGRPIERSADLPLLVGRTPVGKKVKVKVIRQGRRKTLTVRVGELREDVEQAATGGGEGTARSGRLGLEVEELSEAQRRRLNLRDQGVLVRRVHRGPAAEAGIRRGDVILMLDGKPVRSVRQFRKLVDRLPAGKSVPVLVQRGNSPMFLALRLPKEEDGD